MNLIKKMFLLKKNLRIAKNLIKKNLSKILRNPLTFQIQTRTSRKALLVPLVKKVFHEIAISKNTSELLMKEG